MKIYVIYRPKLAEFTVTDAEYALVWSLYNSTNPPKNIAAIRFIKDQYNLPLYDSKAICDVISASRPLDSLIIVTKKTNFCPGAFKFIPDVV